MEFKRVFTKGDGSVYDEVVWKSCVAEVLDESGLIIFKQDNVEVPDFWEQNAINILASKYFRRKQVPNSTIKVVEKELEGFEKYYRSVPAEGAEFSGENSLKQCIDRMVGTWTYWLIKSKLVKTIEEADCFFDELAYGLIHQMWAPNSPQWFNTGLGWAYGIENKDPGYFYFDPKTGTIKEASLNPEESIVRQQSQACFILPIEDSMFGENSIYEQLSTEAKVFKRGSGVGSNFSKLRGANEGLSGGGQSSGLMSFLKIFDRSADSVKSGGVSRRAAKIVVLNVDHPEIEEFIDWKSKEEQKVASLITGSKINNRILNKIIKEWNDLGEEASEEHPNILNLIQEAKENEVELNYVFRAISLAKQGVKSFDFCELNNSFNGDAYRTVSGQNSNNSVSLTDEFLKAVEQDVDWNLVNRIDKKVFKTMKARSLWDKINQSSWSCADPGVFFDTTINSWNTCSNDGRIVSSNPCVSGETFVATENGLQKIKDIIGKEIDIIGSDGELHRATNIVLTGNKRTYKLTTSCGYEIDLTEDHKLGVIGKGKVKASEIVLGEDKINLIGSPFGEKEIDNRKEYIILNSEINQESFIDEVFSLNKESVASIISDLFISDGIVAFNLSSGVIDVSLNLKSLNLLKQVQLLLLSFGIKSKILKTEEYSLRIYKENIIKFYNEISLHKSSDKQNKLEEILKYEFYSDDLTDVIVSFEDNNINEDVYDLTENYTHYFVANGIVVSNCGEYHFLDDTACNLCSIRLTKFFDEEFDIEKFLHLCNLVTIALEMSVEGAILSTPGIAQGTYNYRTIGVGYTDLGALLMRQGIPYDSEEALAWMGVVTSLMTSQAYKTSAMLSKEIGPFPRYEDNQDCMLKVIRNHRRASYNSLSEEYEDLNVAPRGIDIDYCPEYLLVKARQIWDQVLELGEEFGFRNSFVSVIAPVGTIGLVMNCDTLGIEPDFALIKYKKLSGGGYMKIANNSVPIALKNLGYTENQIIEIIDYIIGKKIIDDKCPNINIETLIRKKFSIEQIESLNKSLDGAYHISNSFNKFVLGESFCKDVLKIPEEMLADDYFSIINYLGFSEEEIREANDYICGRGTVEGAPYLNEDHYVIFDCASKCGDYGTRYIPYLAHIRAVSAVQPFLSGSISKCITGESLLFTDRGLLRIGSLRSNELPNTFSNCNIKIDSIDSRENTDSFYYGGFKPVKKIILKDGSEITGTFNHPLYCMNDDGNLEWKQLYNIQNKDYVATKIGSDLWSSNEFNFKLSKKWGAQKEINIPDKMSDDLSWLIGFYMAEGNISKSNYTIQITNSCIDLLDKANNMFKSIFNIDGKIIETENKCPCLRISSKYLCEFFNNINIGNISYEKTIPDCILQSTKNNIIYFINGLMSDGYVVYEKYNSKIGICLNSKSIILDLKNILSNLGVLSNIIAKYNKKYKRNYYELYCSGYYAQLLSNIMMFNEEYRNKKLIKIKESNYFPSTSDIIPNQNLKYLYSLVPKELRIKYNYLSDKRTSNVSFNTIKNMINDKIDIPKNLIDIVENNIHFSKVIYSEQDGIKEVFDISVPNSHAFISNGIINHNTINAPNEITIKEVENCHFEAHKSGLKCISLYRDGSKLSQPLNSVSGIDYEKLLLNADLTDQQVDAEFSVEAFQEAIRHRLPRKRIGYTHEFEIGGYNGPRHKMFLRTGEYPDGRLGEIFIDYAEEDAFARTTLGLLARCVSISLQYNVPLEEFTDAMRTITQDPRGQVLHDNIKWAKSMYDVIGRVLAYEYLGDKDAVEVPDEDDDDRDPQEAKVVHAIKTKNKTQNGVSKREKPAGKSCPQCGSRDTVKLPGSCAIRCRQCKFEDYETCGG